MSYMYTPTAKPSFWGQILNFDYFRGKKLAGWHTFNVWIHYFGIKKLMQIMHDIV